MTVTNSGGDLNGVAPSPSPLNITPGRLRAGLALIILAVLGGLAYHLHGVQGQGAASSFSLIAGVALGFIFQRGRFCFFCIMRDTIAYRNSGPMYSVLVALAIGGIGYAAVMELFLQNPLSGRLAPDAHIGPVSWVLVLAGLVFGLGMTLSGACISGHLYRLGEGYARAPLALFGSLIGFGIGFLTWQTLYIEAIARAPIVWLPSTLGYGGALLVHLLALGAIGWLLWRWVPELPAQTGGRITVAGIYRTLFGQRWNPIVTGALVGVIGVFAYLRVEPLGVTAQLGSITRTFMDDAGLLSGRLPGLDTLAGCATQVVKLIMDNGLLIGGLVFGSLAAALLANRFRVSRLTVRNSASALLGGVLMGWSSMTALGCTIGTLLSGISAFALSGWVFGFAVFAGVWLSLRLRLNIVAEGK